jgi:hypothetical protein
METRNETRNEQTKPRFQIVQLEERIAPSGGSLIGVDVDVKDVNVNILSSHIVNR